ncbi:MAG: DNA-binding protein [Thermoprotei archaeon]|nr:MAG: DNA-binding protein [Thermoprotei archaeon]
MESSTRFVFVERGGSRPKEPCIAVLDATAVLCGGLEVLREKLCYTVPEVLEEVKTTRHRAHLEAFMDLGLLKVSTPPGSYVNRALEAAKRTGDYERLSKTDLQVIALALQLSEERGESVELVSDDYAVQNVASHLGVKYRSLKVRPIKLRVKWAYKCTACGSIQQEYVEVCPICGHKMRRVSLRREEV